MSLCAKFTTFGSVNVQKQMKKTLYLLLATLLFAACSGGNGDDAVLKGNIEGLGTDTIYVYGADGLFSRVDTIVAERGRFEKNIQVDTLLQVWLSFSDGTQYPLFVNKRDRLDIEGSANRLDRLQVSGSDDNELLTAFLADTTSTTIDRVEDFVRNNPASPAGIYLLQRFVAYSDAPDANKIDKIINLMDDRLHDWNAVKRLQEKDESILRIKAGTSAPFFRASTKSGSKTLNSYKDKYLLMHFWASWNQDSRDANKEYRQLYGAKRKDLNILGVSLDMDKQAWQDAVQADSLEWDQTCDYKGWNNNAVVQYAVRHLPSDVLIAPDGNIIAIDLLTSRSIEDKIDEAIKEEKEKDK